MKLYTIGYEGLSMPAFLQSLQEHGIQTIIDVRQYPLSRKPGFSKSRLHSYLSEINISYEHFQALGCPKYIRQAYKENADWRSYCEQFNAYLESQDDSLHELSCLSQESDCALLCFEADHHFCHRSLIAEAIHQRSGKFIGHIN